MRFSILALLCIALRNDLVDSFKVPRPISSLLSAVEVQEIKRDAFSLNSPEYLSNVQRFKDLMKPMHASLSHTKELPKCLGSSNTPDFLAYDNKCGFSVTPSEYCCEVFAEQACADPAMDLVTARHVVSNRIEGLGNAANPFLYETCMMNRCTEACGTDSSDARCKSCGNICQRFCLSNLQHICLKRTCGQNILSVAQSAMMHKKTSRNAALHEATEKEVQEKLKISQPDIRQIENGEIMKFALSLLEKNAAVPLCNDIELVNADAAAKIEVNQAGTTFVESLLRCNAQYLHPNKLEEIIRDPSILGTSEECSVTASCERNHVKLALDRAETQLKVIKTKRAALLAQGN
jgi:hypothetical protein